MWSKVQIAEIDCGTGFHRLSRAVYSELSTAVVLVIHSGKKTCLSECFNIPHSGKYLCGKMFAIIIRCQTQPQKKKIFYMNNIIIDIRIRIITFTNI